MKSMALKNKLTLLAIIICSWSSVFCQNCSLTKLGETPLDLLDTSKLQKSFGSIIYDTSGKYHILLLRSSGEVPKSTVAYISGVNDKWVFEYIENGESLKRKFIKSKRIIEAIKNVNVFSGYFLGECDNNQWSHVGEKLLVINKKEKIIAEFFSYNEDLREILMSDKSTIGLVFFYDLATKLSM